MEGCVCRPLNDILKKSNRWPVQVFLHLSGHVRVNQLISSRVSMCGLCISFYKNTFLYCGTPAKPLLSFVADSQLRKHCVTVNIFLKERMFVRAGVSVSGLISVLRGCGGIRQDYAFPHSDWIIFHTAALQLHFQTCSSI